jgi:hypothetical protein
VADFTYVSTGQSFVYVAFVIEASASPRRASSPRSVVGVTAMTMHWQRP